MAIAHLVHGVAVEIENAPALTVDEMAAARSLQRIQAWGGQRLAEKIALVLVEQGLGGGIDMGIGPFPALGRQVDVALAVECAGVPFCHVSGPARPGCAAAARARRGNAGLSP